MHIAHSLCFYLFLLLETQIMKKILLVTAAFLAAITNSSAQCTELFISEYVEGTFFNKALELYNPTGNPIDLSAYRLIRWDNGSTDADQAGGDGILNLSGTINAYSTFVVVINTTLQGTEVPPDIALVAKADAFYGTSCIPGTGIVRTLCFNGDDALSLQKNVSNVWTNVDIFGSIGERPSNSQGLFSPGAGWTDIAPFSSMPSNYDGTIPYFLRYWTLDQTLVRKASVVEGVSANPDPETFNPSVQWDSLAENTFDSLGFHHCTCNIAGISRVNDGRKISIYPLPASDFLNVVAEEAITGVDITDISGKLISSVKFANIQKEIKLATGAMPAGVYFLRLNFRNGQVSYRKIQIAH